MFQSTTDTIKESIIMKDLAPSIHRQRLIIEGYPDKPVTEQAIKDYLSELAEITDMVRLTDPVTHQSIHYGWAGWVHWETSGAHFYAWDQPVLFFSVDIYTCKAFDVEKTVEFTKKFFGADQVEYKDV